MSYDKKKLGNLFSIICNNTQKAPFDASKHARLRILGGAGSTIVVKGDTHPPIIGKMPVDGPPTLFVTGDGCDAFDSLVEEVLRDPDMAHAVGERAIKDQLGQLLRDIGGIFPSEETDLAHFIRMRLLKPLKDQLTEWVVHVPLANLRVCGTLVIGDVEIAMYEKGLLLPKITHEHFDSSGIGVSEKNVGKSLPANIIEAARQYDCWATTKLTTNEQFLSTSALRRVGQAVNALRAFTYILFPRNRRCIFDIGGFAHRGKYIAFGQGNAPTIHSASAVVGYLFPFELTQDTLALLRQEMHFERLCQLVGMDKSARTELGETVVVASYWLGRAAAAETIEDEFVRVAIALERLINCREEAATDKIAVRLALLISNEREERLSILKNIKRLYDIRSRIVHDGYIGVMQDNMDELLSYAIRSLVRCLRLTDSLSTHDELSSMLTQKMLESGD